MENAFYYREGYYLLPEEYSDVNRLRAAVKKRPLTLTVKQLLEDNRIRFNIQKGVCIAPFFYGSSD